MWMCRLTKLQTDIIYLVSSFSPMNEEESLWVLLACAQRKFPPGCRPAVEREAAETCRQCQRRSHDLEWGRGCHDYPDGQTGWGSDSSSEQSRPWLNPAKWSALHAIVEILIPRSHSILHTDWNLGIRPRITSKPRENLYEANSGIYILPYNYNIQKRKC